MKRFSFKKVLAIVLTLAVVMSFVPMTVSAAGTDASSITLEDGVVTLNLDYATTYYTSVGSLNDVTVGLMDSALEAYNAANSTALTSADIKGLKVTTQPGVKIIKGFNTILKTNLPQLEVIDMYDSVVTAQETSATQSASDNYMHEDYFNGLTNLKKVVLPAGLVNLKARAFQNLTKLEEVVFGDALVELPEKAFYGCTALTKLDLPASLNVASVWADFFTNSGITELSFHGTSSDATFLTRFTTAVKAITNLTKLDLSNSGIDAANVSTLAQKATLEYIDLSGCANIDLNSIEGQALYSQLVALHSAGKTVKLPPIPDGFEASNKNSGLRNSDSEIIVNGDTTELVLDLGFTYGAGAGNGADSGFVESANNTYDLRYHATLLMEDALSLYNFNNGTKLTANDINKLTISTKTDIWLTAAYVPFVKVKLPNLKELDLSNAAFTGDPNNSYSGHRNKVLKPEDVGALYTLSGLANLKKLALPKGVTTIEGAPFQNLSSLECLVLPDSISITGLNCFYGCGSLKTIVAKDVVNVRETAITMASLKNIVFTGTNFNFVAHDTGNNSLTSPSEITLYCADATAYAGVNALNQEKLAKVVYVGDMSAVNVVDGGDVELAKAGSLFGGLSKVEGAEKIYNVKWNAAELLNKWVQHKAVDNTYTLRFVSTIDSLDYQNVGFAVSLYNSNPTIDGANCAYDTSTKVYSTWNSGTAQLTPEQAGAHESANFFFAYKLTGVPADFDGTIYVRPFYTTTDGTVVYGSTTAGSLNNFIS